jgi:hypothetical protein
LNVDGDIAVDFRDDFSEAIGAGLMRRFGQADATAKITDARGDSQIVGRDDHFGDRQRRFSTPIDVFDHRTAVDVREGLAWEACRPESSGDECDDLEWMDEIDRRTSRRGVHGES